jgi:hypothetical protein
MGFAWWFRCYLYSFSVGTLQSRFGMPYSTPFIETVKVLFGACKATDVMDFFRIFHNISMPSTAGSPRIVLQLTESPRAKHNRIGWPLTSMYGVLYWMTAVSSPTTSFEVSVGSLTAPVNLMGLNGLASSNDS